MCSTVIGTLPCTQANLLKKCQLPLLESDCITVHDYKKVVIKANHICKKHFLPDSDLNIAISSLKGSLYSGKNNNNPHQEDQGQREESWEFSYLVDLDVPQPFNASDDTP